jgi:hypothetical protein
VLEQTISSVRELEQSIEGRALADLRVRLALRGLIVGDQGASGEITSEPNFAVVRLRG